MTVEKDNILQDEQKNTEHVELTEEETVETVFDEEVPENQENSLDENQLLQKKSATLEAKIEEMESRYLRLQADFDNFRRRSRLEAEASEKYRAQKLITDILPALDNFERALKVNTENDQTKSLLQGMEMVYRILLDALKKEGLEPIEAVGKEFDPHLHQAVMQGEDGSIESNFVMEEFQKGYLLKDRVIRPSMVKVNQ